MPLSIQQNATYVGRNRWKWSVWLEGPAEELDSVDHVTYILHPSFHNPVREISDRASGFRLDTSGWGTFRIYAKVFMKSGEERLLEHDLKLYYPDGTPTAA
jgi:transcription initiation factor IIF auxiliary subunit